MFEAIAGSAKVLLGGFSSTVFRFVDGMAHLKAFTPTTPEADKVLQSSFPRPVADSAPFQTTQAGEVMQVPDTEAPGYEFKEIARARGYRSMLYTPLTNNGVSIGFIAVTRLQPGSFAEEHVQLLKTFADQAVIAISNVELFGRCRSAPGSCQLRSIILRGAQDRLVQTEKLASLGQLTAGIAHEIKNPLNFVNNFSTVSAELVDELSEVLKPAALDDKTRKEIDELTDMLKGNLEKVVLHGRRADSIVKNMLLHSREGSGEHRPVDLNALVEESLNLAYHGARAEKPMFNVTIKREFDPEAGMVEVFPQEITRVLINLISNGFYAVSKRTAEAGGFEPEITASTRGASEHIEIRIRDNGTGIPPEVKEKMFNPFFTTKPAGEGTGLGLSMSHDIIVKQHGGTIRVDTEPGVFTEFIVMLPRAISAQKPARSANMSTYIVVVDDEPDVESMFRQHFRRDLRSGRFVMEFALSAPAALEQVKAIPDPSLILILSDINMPGMTGLEMLPKVKAARPNVPVIMITAYGDDATRKRASELGAAGLLPKPIDFGLLRREIDQRLEGLA